MRTSSSVKTSNEDIKIVNEINNNNNNNIKKYISSSIIFTALLSTVAGQMGSFFWGGGGGVGQLGRAKPMEVREKKILKIFELFIPEIATDAPNFKN